MGGDDWTEESLEKRVRGDGGEKMLECAEPEEFQEAGR